MQWWFIMSLPPSMKSRRGLDVPADVLAIGQRYSVSGGTPGSLPLVNVDGGYFAAIGVKARGEVRTRLR